MSVSLEDRIAADPAGAWYALDCVDARDSLHAFCGMIEIPGAPVGEEDDEAADWKFQPIETPQAAHHKALIDLCERLESGRTRRAMVFMPPGSAKSTYASVVFPAWAMGRKRRNIILGTYASDLARKMGRRMRAVTRQPVYRDIMRCGLDPESRAAEEFALTNGSEFMGGGILSGITGNRADGFVVDDPIKNRQDADSEQVRQRTREEFEDTVRTRLKPHGWVLMILTRWHEDDLAGGLLPDDWDGESGIFRCKDGLDWEVLCIPAEAEAKDPLGRKPGEMLWPEWFGKDPDFWTAARRNARTWSALYQQRPAPAEGTFFKRDWFRRYRPADIEGLALRHYLTSDHAPTDGDESDPSGARVWGLAASGDVYLRDGFLHRATMDVTADRIVGNLKTGPRRPDPPTPMNGLLRKWGVYAWLPEDDNNWKAARPFIVRQMKEEGVHTILHAMSPHGHDKATKAQAAQGMASMGLIWVPEGPEGDEIIDRYVKFPAGRDDEEVDMLAIMARAIDLALPAVVKPEPPPAPEAPRGLNQMTWDELHASTPRREERL